jgi:hypothetical protein
MKHLTTNVWAVLLTYMNSEIEELEKGRTYLTVTDFAKFLGVSGLIPFSTAI